jgi:hypothetical protein
VTDLTDSTYEVTRAVHQLFEENKVGLGLLDVYYGDQDKLPRTPCAAVESGSKNRQLNGAPRRTLVTIDVYVIIYFGRVTDGQFNQAESEKMAEAAEALLHQNEDLNGLVIHSLVVTNEPGYVIRGGAQVKASRLTFQCTSQKMLPYSAGGE